jgi:hypothetical protein
MLHVVAGETAMKEKKVFSYSIFLIFLFEATYCSINIPTPFWPPIFFGKTHSAYPFEWSLNITPYTGSTRTAFAAEGATTTLLDRYGPENVKLLAKGVPESILNRNPNSALNTLYQQATSDNFGHLRWHGEQELSSWDITYIQNLIHGFFVEISFPFRSIEVDDITFTDQSTKISSNDVNYEHWKTITTNFCNHMEQYDLLLRPYEWSGIGDMYCLLGWSFCLCDNKMLDAWNMRALETTIRFGVSLPTSQTVRYNDIFALPLGNDGFVVVPYSFDCSIYARPWLTIGGHVGGIFSCSQTKTIGIQTAENQQGYLKVATDCVKVDRGPVWIGGFFLEFKPVPHRLSLLLGYSYTHGEKTFVDTKRFNYATANKNVLLEPWSYQMFHAQLEWYFKDSNGIGPAAVFYLNTPFCGHRSVDMTTLGAGIQLSYCW